MIDPFTALAAIQTAVKLVKTAAQTVKDVESLGPVLGKFFSAKSDAIKVVQQSKTGGFKGSAMGKAIELELAIESARSFEEEIKMLFFQSNKMDVWAKILARAASIDKEAAHEARRQREAAARHKKEMDEVITLVLMFVVLALVCGGVGWIIYRAVQECGGKC
jgi:predicted Rdx family selenoprotein